MVSIITSISLDAETMDIKDRLIANYGFSKWVRECLRRYAAENGEATHPQPEDMRIRGLCNGLLVPHCRLCWPMGPPTRDDWIEWRMGRLEQQPQPRVAYFALPDTPAKKKRDKAPAKETTRGLLSRFLKWLL
jgi:hypothetical protein